MRRGRGKKRKGRIDYIQSNVRAFGIAKYSNAMALEAGSGLRQSRRGERRFMAAWRKEEEDAVRHLHYKIRKG